MCGRPNKSMYGTRDAAQNWEEHYSQVHKEIGFTQGLSSTCVFFHNERRIMVVIHGDDFTALGHDKDLDCYRNDDTGQNEHESEGQAGTSQG